MIYQWDDFSLDTVAFRLERAGGPLPMEPKALDVLVLLVGRAGQLVTKQEILESVWPQTAVTDYALTRVIAQIRKTLGDEVREARFIETVPTRGYRWIRPVSQHEATPTATVNATPSPSSPARAGLMGGGWLRRVEGFSAIAIIGVVAIAYLLNGRKTETTATSLAIATPDITYPEQLTTAAGVDLHPTISPQGDAVAYASDRSGALEIYVRALTGAGVETPLTSDGAENTQPAWSPNGASIAYHSIAKGGIWIVPARGGVPRQLVAEGASPAWSPDGRRIAFQTDEYSEIAPNAFPAQIGSVIRIVEAAGGAPTDLTAVGKPVGGHGSPAWSPDGRFVAFVVFEGGDQNGLWRVAADTGDIAPLATKESVYEPTYAPDGSAIYAAGGNEAFIVRWLLDANTGRVSARHTIPLPGVSGVRGLSIARDGGRLLFSGLWLDSQIWALPVTANGNANGDAYPLTKDRSARNLMPAISPDGRQIAYMSRRQGQRPNIAIMNPDGSNVVQLTSDEASESQPHWFPDSQRIAYLSNRDNRLGIWGVDINTRREEMLIDAALVKPTAAKQLAGEPIPDLRLSPSAKQAVFAVMTPPVGRRALQLMSLEDLTPRALTDGSASVAYPTWSTDGRQIAVMIKDGGSTAAGVIEVATGRLRQLTKGRGHTWTRGWSPDSRKMAAAFFRDGRWSLRWIDAQSGQDSIIIPPAPPKVYLRYPEWSSGGDSIVFERGEAGGNIWSIRLKQ